MTKDDAYKFLIEDLRFAARTFFENMFDAAELDPEGEKESKYIKGLTDIAVKVLGDAMADIVESAQEAERRAMEQYKNYAGLAVFDGNGD